MNNARESPRRDLPQTSGDSLFRTHPRNVSGKLEIWLVIILVCAGGLLRLATLDHDSLWFDEGISVSASGFSLGYLWSVPFDVHPPVYFTLLHAFRALGDSETILRLPSALASTLTLVPAYLLARALIGRAGALIALALLAGSYVNLTYAVTARNYAVLFLLLMTAFAALHHVWSRYRTAPSGLPGKLALPALLYVVAAIGALYTHNIAVFYILLANTALALHTLFDQRRTFLPVWLGLVGLNIPVLLAWLPWLMVIPGASPDFVWLEQPCPGQAFRTLLHAATPIAASKWAMLALLPILLTGTLAAAMRNAGAFTVIALHLIALPLVIWLLGHVYKPVFLERTILPASFGAALAAGTCLAYVRRPLMGGLASSVAIFAAVTSSLAFTGRWGVTDVISQQPVEDWRGALAAADAHDADAVILCRLVEYSIARYYSPDTDYWVPLQDGRIAPLIEGVWEDVLGRPASSRPDMDAAILASLAQRGANPVSPEDLAGSARHIGIVSSSHCIHTPDIQRWMRVDYPARLQSAGFSAAEPVRRVNVWYQAYDRPAPAD